jgi:preprotein translocase subunit SecA
MISLHDYITDYTSSEHFLFIDAPLKEYTEQLLNHFCTAISEPVTIATIETALHSMARLDLPLSVRQKIPELLTAFFEFLGSSGKYPASSTWASDISVVEKGYLSLFRDDGTVRGATFAKQYTDVGRNDPCPCGSGKKFKKCCG